MAASFNRVTLIGNLGQDPELKYSAAGDAILNFSVATSESWKDKNTGERQERTEWHRCVAYRQPAEFLGKYAKKGNKTFVEGKLQTRKWVDKDGQERTTTEIQASNVMLLSGKDAGDDGERTSRPGKPPQYGGGRPAAAAPDLDEDIPF
ncbi:MAG: single-stranded DNA-binding protein [Gammaproteobacteria bacterium]|nr:single-stranded DNA-binding protein [Gammaproteobacteria bacterium]